MLTLNFANFVLSPMELNSGRVMKIMLFDCVTHSNLIFKRDLNQYVRDQNSSCQKIR